MVTFSCFFHQSFGIPLPNRLDGAPFVFPLPPTSDATLLGPGLKRPVFQGSSDAKAEG